MILYRPCISCFNAGVSNTKKETTCTIIYINDRFISVDVDCYICYACTSVYTSLCNIITKGDASTPVRLFSSIKLDGRWWWLEETVVET